MEKSGWGLFGFEKEGGGREAADVFGGGDAPAAAMVGFGVGGEDECEVIVSVVAEEGDQGLGGDLDAVAGFRVGGHIKFQQFDGLVGFQLVGAGGVIAGCV